MSLPIQSKKSLNANTLTVQNKEADNTANSTHSLTPIIPESQVVVKKTSPPKRSYDTAYKIKVLSAFNSCKDASERGAILRKEGLYHSRISAWKKQLETPKLNGKKAMRDALRSDNLIRENDQLKKKLAHAEAIIELQKKISELLGMHILPTEQGGLKS